MHICPLCPVLSCVKQPEFPSLEALVRHLMVKHQKEEVTIGHKKEKLNFYKATYGRIDRNAVWRTDRKVLCLCGERFTLNNFDDCPLFPELPTRREWNSFLAHLRREGGIARHLAQLREEAVFDRIDETPHANLADLLENEDF